MNILALDYGPDLINDVANQYINAINNGFGLIKGDVTWILNVLIILSIMWSAALWALSDDHVMPILPGKSSTSACSPGSSRTGRSLTDKLARPSWTWASRPADSTARVLHVPAWEHRLSGIHDGAAADGSDRAADRAGRVLQEHCRDCVPVPCHLRDRRGVLRHHHSGRRRGVDIQVRELWPRSCWCRSRFCQKRHSSPSAPWVGGGSGVRLMVLTLVLGVGNNIFQSLQGAGGPDRHDLSGFLHRPGGAAAHGAFAGRLAPGHGHDYRRPEPGRRHGDQYDVRGLPQPPPVGSAAACRGLPPAVAAVKAAAAVRLRGRR